MKLPIVSSIVSLFAPIVVALVLVALSHTPSSAEILMPKSRDALLLLKTTSGGVTTTTFGREAVVGAGGKTIIAALEKMGVTFILTSGLSIGVGDAPSGLPLSDETAIHMARQTSAVMVIIAGIEVRDEGRIRGTILVGQKASIRLRALDVAASTQIVDLRAETAVYHSASSQGNSDAVDAVVDKLLDLKFVGTLANHFPQPDTRFPETESFTLSIKGAQSWRQVAAILQRLASIKGVENVSPVFIDKTRVTLSLVSTGAHSSMIASLRRTQLHQQTISATQRGQDIEVRLTTRVAPNE